jgi:SAM-dependent methyltransferase
MKVRDSGMPEEAAWEGFFDCEAILDRLAIDDGIGDVAEVGCGYGTFTLPVARRITGTLYAFDIDEAMVSHVTRRTSAAGLSNVDVARRDVLADGFGLVPASLDGCLLFNILHHEDPVAMLSDAATVVRAGGRVFAIHWRYDEATPRGPELSIRPRPGDIMRWASETGLLKIRGSELDLPPWHYGLVLEVR